MKATRSIGLKLRKLLALGIAGLLVISASSLIVTPAARAEGKANQFEFAILGDTGYTPREIDEFEAVLQEMNRENLAFVVHVGDFKGTQACTDEFFAAARVRFQASVHPLIYTPGDNEWTDCAQQPPHDGTPFALPLRDPLDALEKIRQMFFIEQGNQSLGQKTLTLVRQSDKRGKFVENQRWVYGNILFATLHIVGSRDNCPMRTIPTPSQDFYGNQIIDSTCVEKNEREVANVEWLHDTFAEARLLNAQAVMIFTQANMLPVAGPYGGQVAPANNPNRIPFNAYLEALEEETREFSKPVVLAHGDTHYFRMDKPMRNWFSPTDRADNFIRLETFGSPENKWVRVRVDLRDPNVFAFQQGRPQSD